MAGHSSNPTVGHEHGDHGTHEVHGTVFKRIWIPFFILLAITLVEFAIALYAPDSIGKVTKSIIFLALTVVKAFYIIAYFMHLKFERVALIMVLGIPVGLIIYLIVLLLLEGDYVKNILA